MPRPKRKNEHRPSYWFNPEKFRSADVREIINFLGLDVENDIDTCKAVLNTITRDLGDYRAAHQNELSEPTDAALAAELTEALGLCRKLRISLADLSPLARQEVEQAQVFAVARTTRPYDHEDLASVALTQRQLRDVPRSILSLEKNMTLAIQNLEARESRRARPKIAFRRLIRSLEKSFNCYVKGDENTPEALNDFICYILNCKSIPHPKNLRPYLRSN